MTTLRLTTNQQRALRAYPSSTSSGSTPRDGGQIVERHWRTTEYYVYEYAHDRSDDEVTIEAYAAPRDWDEFEPWNGSVPTGRRIGVIYRGTNPPETDDDQ